MEASERLSEFVDGEAVDPAELAEALSEPGAREMLVDFLRLRAAVAEVSGPSQAFVARTQARLRSRAVRVTPRLLRVAATLLVAALACVGVLDLLRGVRPAEEPPRPTRVIRFEPGVDWKPVEGRR